TLSQTSCSHRSALSHHCWGAQTIDHLSVIGLDVLLLRRCLKIPVNLTQPCCLIHLQVLHVVHAPHPERLESIFHLHTTRRCNGASCHNILTCILHLFKPSHRLRGRDNMALCSILNALGNLNASPLRICNCTAKRPHEDFLSLTLDQFLSQVWVDILFLHLIVELYDIHSRHDSRVPRVEL